jgi:hypothetical protein
MNETVVMFGYYDVPLRIAKEGISLSVEREEEALLYRIESVDEEVEKHLLASTGKILINPVEPLNKPKEVTSYLLIEFERTLVVEPGATQKIYAKYSRNCRSCKGHPHILNYT